MALIPASVWAHPVTINLNWVAELLHTNGVAIILGDIRRENALAQCLRKARDIDSLVPRQWHSWYDKKSDGHTNAYKIEKSYGVLAIAVREQLSSDSLLDRIQAHHGLVIVGAERPIKFLKTIHEVMLPHG